VGRNLLDQGVSCQWPKQGESFFFIKDAL